MAGLLPPIRAFGRGKDVKGMTVMIMIPRNDVWMIL
jgi:hypothetical protein